MAAYERRMGYYWDFVESFYRDITLPAPIDRERGFQFLSSVADALSFLRLTLSPEMTALAIPVRFLAALLGGVLCFCGIPVDPTIGSRSATIEASEPYGITAFRTRPLVETESAVSGERTICRADRSKLDLNRDCIERELLAPTGEPGTTITAHVSDGEQISVQKARDYIAEFVSLVDLPVRVNGETVSQKLVEDLIPPVPEAWATTDTGRKIGSRMTSDVTVILSQNADLWLRFTNIVWDSRDFPWEACASHWPLQSAHIP